VYIYAFPNYQTVCYHLIRPKLQGKNRLWPDSASNGQLIRCLDVANSADQLLACVVIPCFHSDVSTICFLSHDSYHCKARN